MQRQPHIIAAGRVIASGRELTPGAVEIAGGRIVRVREGTSRNADMVVDDGILAPGLIDLQINGAAGVDFLTCEDEAELRRARGYLASTGVTGFLPTLISAPLDHTRAALLRWQCRAAQEAGPRILGVHLEGPYLNPAFSGAHDPQHLRTPAAAECATLLDAVPGLVKLVTLAPELPGIEPVIQVIRQRGSIVSAGHTNATYDEAKTRFAEGVAMVTHLFNTMRPLHHRDPGIVGAALDHPAVIVGLIADLVHVHPAMIRLVIALKGWRRCVLVTDAVAAAGTGTRTSSLGGRELQVTDAPRLPDGRLAGSGLSMDHALRNVVALGVPVGHAIRMATAVPAGILGRRDLGRLVSGAWADLVIFDHALNVVAVYIAGRQVYARAPHS